MKTNTKTLLEALTKLRPIFSGRTTLPALSLIKLTSDDDHLTISANDLDMSCRIRIDGTKVDCWKCGSKGYAISLRKAKIAAK